MLVISHGTMLAGLIAELLPDAPPVRFPNVGVVTIEFDENGPVDPDLHASWLVEPTGPPVGTGSGTRALP